MTEKHDLAKLPLWVRHRIEKLEADLASAHKSMSEMLGANHVGRSNVVLPYFRLDMHDQYLPKDSKVQFMVPHPWREPGLPGYIEVKHYSENVIDIHGSQLIWIEPYSGNCCKIRFRDRE